MALRNSHILSGKTEVRMEVVNEAEAIEYCTSHRLVYDHCYEGRGTNSGKLMMLAYKFPERTQEALVAEYEAYMKSLGVEVEYGYIVYTIYNGQKMYYCRNKHLDMFQRQNAYIFKSESEADTTANFMNMRGAYKWKVMYIQVK